MRPTGSRRRARQSHGEMRAAGALQVGSQGSPGAKGDEEERPSAGFPAVSGLNLRGVGGVSGICTF